MCLPYRRAWLTVTFATVKNAYMLKLADQGGSILPERNYVERTPHSKGITGDSACRRHTQPLMASLRSFLDTSSPAWPNSFSATPA